jgi:hypothetical protein
MGEGEVMDYGFCPRRTAHSSRFGFASFPSLCSAGLRGA